MRWLGHVTYLLFISMFGTLILDHPKISLKMQNAWLLLDSHAVK